MFPNLLTISLDAFIFTHVHVNPDPESQSRITQADPDSVPNPGCAITLLNFFYLITHFFLNFKLRQFIFSVVLLS
jgi:hypothetical protein